MSDIDWSSLRVLVVDDNANFRRITRTILQAVRVADIEEVTSAAEALERLSDYNPDVVLSDWRMEGMDGLEFVRTLRDKGVTTPVVMMTGYGEEDFETRAKDAGVTEFLEKPVTPKSIISSVARALARTAA